MTKTGSIYKQKNSRFWWVKYYRPGDPKPIRESTGTEDHDEAQSFLWRRLGEVATGKFQGLEPERIKVSELFNMLQEDYESRGRATLRQLKLRVKVHLRPFFGALKASTVGTRQITTYVAKRKRDGAKNATINRELESLRRAFNLGFAAQPQLVLRPLKFEKLPEDNIREGLVDHSQYLVLREGLSEPYKTLFVCGYHLGTRLGELSKVKWSEVDFARGEITLLRYTTKTKKPRILPIYGDMVAFLTAAKDLRDRLYPECPWVFHRKGKPFAFRHRTWNEKVAALGLPEIRFHDLRRTAATNMLEAGFDRKEIRAITGHLTDRMFDRYAIVRRNRIHAVGQGMEKYLEKLEKEAQKREKDDSGAGRVAGIEAATTLLN